MVLMNSIGSSRMGNWCSRLQHNYPSIEQNERELVGDDITTEDDTQ